MLTIDTITDDAGFRALADDWRELLADSASDQPFLTYEWLHAWWMHLRSDRELHIVTVRDDGRLVALAPLALRPPRLARVQPYRLFEFLGSGEAGSDYLDFIIRRGHEQPALDALARHFTDNGRVLELSRVKPDSSCATVLGQRLDDSGWTMVDDPTDVCPYIELAGHDWDSYLATLSSAHRYNVRRRFRNLEKAFTVEFEECIDDVRRTECLAELVRLHHIRRDELGGSDALHTDELVAFHEDFTRRAMERGWLRLFVLKLDGAPVAAVYGLMYDGIFHFYQSGFDPAFNKYSVGLVVLGHSIRRAIEDGAREYDLLHGDEGYKFRWASAQRPLSRLTLFPPDTHGKLTRGLARLKDRVKSLRGGETTEGKWRAA